MIEYCYPECTTSVITSLAIFKKHYPHYRARDIEWVQPFRQDESWADFLSNSVKPFVVPLSSFMLRKNLKEGGWALGESVSHTQPSLPQKVSP